MKRHNIIAIFVVLLIIAAASRATDDIVSRLGTSQEHAQRSILNNFIGDFDHDEINVAVVEDGDSASTSMYDQKSFQVPTVKFLSQIISGDKSAAAADLCEYVRDYVNSEKFVDAYQRARASAKPTREPFVLTPEMLDDQRKELKELEVNLATMKAQNMPEAYIKQMGQAIVFKREFIEKNSDSTPNKTQWEKMYPENPADMVKTRLEEYLQLLATVDFNATTIGTGKQVIFTNPEYERKSLKWKAIYRAGKEVNDVVAAFTKEWLREGVISGTKVDTEQRHSN